MPSRWNAGWVRLPGTKKFPGEALHRVHWDRRLSTCCDRVVGSYRVNKTPPGGVPWCSRCQVVVTRSRRAARAAAERKMLAALKGQTKIVDTDAYDRAKAASTSLWASSGGLPGLGRRR